MDNNEEEFLEQLFQQIDLNYPLENIEVEVMRQIGRQKAYGRQKRTYALIGHIGFGSFLLLSCLYLITLLGGEFKLTYYIMGAPLLLALGLIQLEMLQADGDGVLRNFFKFRKVLLIVLCLTTVGVKAQSLENFASLFADWEQSSIEQPGVSLAVIKDDQVLFQESRGYANLEYDIPLTDQSVFDIASLAKQFTGFAIAKLYLDGQLHLDDPVRQYITGIPVLDNRIQIRHLVYHTSGLRDIAELHPLAYSTDYLTTHEAMEIIKHQRELNFNPGTEHDYSNTNYVLLALIVEKVSGQSFKEWCRENLFMPLRMNHSFVNDNPMAIIPNRAVAYYSDEAGFSFTQNNGMALIGSSAVYSTLEDMVVWLRALQNETLFPEVIRLMKQKGKLDNGQEIEYGFGLGISETRNEILFEHSGATPAGFRTAMAIFPEHSLAIVIMSNWGDINPIRDFGMKIIDLYFPQPKKEKTSSEKNQEPGIQIPQKILSSYLGDYVFNGESKVQIMPGEENQLTLRLGEGPEMMLVPVTAAKFELPAMKSTLSFTETPQGNSIKAEVWMEGNKVGELIRVKREMLPDSNLSRYEGRFLSDELNVFFDIKWMDDKLWIMNTKQGPIPMERNSEKVFNPNGRIASSLVFQLDENGEVTGLLLNRGSRVRNLNFQRLEN